MRLCYNEYNSSFFGGYSKSNKVYRVVQKYIGIQFSLVRPNTIFKLATFVLPFTLR